MASTTNPNVADNFGQTPIHAAAYNGHLKIVRVLMKATNNPNPPENAGMTPENLASQRGHHDIVRLLRNFAIIRSLLEI